MSTRGDLELSPVRYPRVISLVPSVTETLRSWGYDPIACTRYCEQRDLPTVGGVKNPDLDAIRSLDPDLVVMDRQENRREDADALVEMGVELLVLDVTSIAGLGVEMARLLDAVAPSTRQPSLPADPSPTNADRGRDGTVRRRRRAFVPIWRRPWMTIGGRTYGSDLLSAVGIDNIFADTDGYPTVALEHVAARVPDVVVVPSEPYSFRADELAELSDFAPVVRIDGRDLFWWGARTPHAIGRIQQRLATWTD